ncbi:MAG: hydantoinase/oxoprolinase family protein [Syntrophobacteraceae bacterium]|jgi:N-methylhydantoinase A/oxoprolinase/acetone carboxylase beta subunit|nr:hydantoinase/oxoprolinase family protein [Syntrophobacteraceae bacterium]
MIIGLDVGGTHTDAVLIADGSIQRQVKVPTDPASLFDSVWTGLDDVLRGVDRERLQRIVLSTTLTTNCLVERKYSEPGMIVVGGPGMNAAHYRTGPFYFVVSGSIDHRGREIRSVESGEIEALASKLRSEGVRQVGVVGKFSVRNPVHEIQIREILGNGFDYVVLGHRLSGSLNFPRRIATAYLNAAVYPAHKRFYEAVRESLHRKGLRVPIHILKADGGTMSLEASLESPGQTMLSGPAASVMGALPFASEREETLVLDIGGTTTDMAVLVRGAPLLDPLGIEVGGTGTLLRALKTRSLGLGGDSAARVKDGQVVIGPDRAGPAMAFGGSVPTPTDALFVLGKMKGGDAHASRGGILTIAEPLGMTAEGAATLIFDQACRIILEEAAQMIADINSQPVYTVHELLEGHRVRPTEVLVLGGPAPHFALRLASLTDFQVHVVPRWHVANAMGAALARTTSEVAVFADSERGYCIAPGEGFRQPVPRDFDRRRALEVAYRLLGERHAREGGPAEGVEMEVVEESEFSMVRDSYMTGRNIRIKVQVKPGLIPEYRKIARGLVDGRSEDRGEGCSSVLASS